MTDLLQPPAAPPAATPVATPIVQLARGAPLCVYAGVETPRAFSRADEELAALTAACGVFDQGWRSALRIIGPDRLRWLNGMVTNTVKDLAPGHWNYTFLLNAQGRIQGDAEVFALPDSLLFVTDHDHAPRLQAHLDRFIIMDDVELAAETTTTSIGIAGPAAHSMLSALALPARDLAPGSFFEHDALLVIRTARDRYTFRAALGRIPQLWPALIAAGAVPAGADALESLRILEGRPRYGVDIHERTLAQETGQMHALNFNKGCYLGQEIVERIRSRANVHRSIRSFALQGEAPAPATAIYTQADTATAVGELTSITSVQLLAFTGIYAIGTVRSEAAAAPLAYAGGTAHALAQAPLHGS